MFVPLDVMGETQLKIDNGEIMDVMLASNIKPECIIGDDTLKSGRGIINYIATGYNQVVAVLRQNLDVFSSGR